MPRNTETITRPTKTYYKKKKPLTPTVTTVKKGLAVPMRKNKKTLPISFRLKPINTLLTVTNLSS